MAPVTGNNLPAPFAYLLDKPWVVLDTETTGLGTSAEVCEIAITEGLTGETLLNTLVRPTVRIEPGAERVHKISNALVAEANPWPVVRQQLINVLNGKTVCIYNANFDIRIMWQSSQAHGIDCDGYFGAKEYFCVMTEYARRKRIYNHFRAGNRSFKLSVAAEFEGIPVPINLHRAVADTTLTRELVAKILREFTDSANQDESSWEDYEGDWPAEPDCPEAEPWREL